MFSLTFYSTMGGLPFNVTVKSKPTHEGGSY